MGRKKAQMGNPKKKTHRNGQEYQPPYQFWHEPDFSSDEQVAYGTASDTGSGSSAWPTPE
jgi:hypothetical protein